MSFQSVTLLGNLGSDPDLRHTPSGVPVCSFSLAVNQRWTNANGETREKTVWFRVTAWRNQAEVIDKYFSKGKPILVVGELDEPRVYTDKSGQARASLDVTLRQFSFVGGRDGNGNGNGNGGGGQGGARAKAADPLPDTSELEALDDIPF